MRNNHGRKERALFLFCLPTTEPEFPELDSLKLQPELRFFPTEKSSRQLRRHILPVADMEATSYIRYLLALGAVWNIDPNDCSGAETLLSHAMG
jgi:hypothetical protein